MRNWQRAPDTHIHAWERHPTPTITVQLLREYTGNWSVWVREAPEPPLWGLEDNQLPFHQALKRGNELARKFEANS